MRHFLRLAAAILIAVAGTARAGETVVVLGSDLAPYREAYEAFKVAFGAPVELLPMGARLPKDVKVVVAFGGKAALQRYSDRTTLIYGLAPGLEVTAETHDGSNTMIRMEPEAGALLQKLTEVQPGLKRLGVIWSSEGHGSAMERLAEAIRKRGLKPVVERISGADEMPSALRRLKGKVDALWLPPDPLVINARNFEMIKSYAYGNDVPFYAPVEGLAEKGAAAAVSVSNAEMGRAAATAARDALAGELLPAEIFVSHVRLAVNLSAARECELTVPPSVLKAADKVSP